MADIVELSHPDNVELVAGAVQNWADLPAPAAAEPASPRLAELEERLDKAVADLEALEERLAAVEERLGEANRFRSPMDTIERRLEDLEEDLEDLKR